MVPSLYTVCTWNGILSDVKHIYIYSDFQMQMSSQYIKRMVMPTLTRSEQYIDKWGTLYTRMQHREREAHWTRNGCNEDVS